MEVIAIIPIKIPLYLKICTRERAKMDAMHERYLESTVPPMVEKEDVEICFFYDATDGKSVYEMAEAKTHLAQLSLDRVLAQFDIHDGTVVEVEQLFEGVKSGIVDMVGKKLPCVLLGRRYPNDQYRVLSFGRGMDFQLFPEYWRGYEFWHNDSPVEAVAVCYHKDCNQVDVCWRTASQDVYRMIRTSQGGGPASVPGTVLRALIPTQN